jgi:hypothetical protein
MTCSRYTESDSGRIKVVTSATRPTGANRYIGQRIFETDTGRELTYDGTGWIIMAEPVQSFTPSFGNVTLGNGSRTGLYRRSDGWLEFVAYIVLGSTSSVGGSVTLTLPVTATNIVSDQLRVALTDTSAGQIYMGRANANATAPTIYYALVSGGLVGLNTLSATAPFTWAAGDAIEVSGRYAMATRYS